MNWINKIFQKENSKESNSKLINDQQDSTLKWKVSVKDKFLGIDDDFINLFYFNNEEEKYAFKNRIKNIITYLGITSDTEIVAAHKMLTDYNDSIDDPIPFLTECILFLPYHHTELEFQVKIEIIEKQSIILESGSQKINSYYSALSFATENLKRKINHKFYNFQFEENLINETLSKNNHADFARLNSLFDLGFSFYKSKDLVKMENYFNVIRKEEYDLSPVTVSNYFRSIGEIYIELIDNNKALEWFKAGLILNPKLGVKKQINQLENNIQ